MSQFLTIVCGLLIAIGSQSCSGQAPVAKGPANADVVSGGHNHWHDYDYTPISKEWWSKRKKLSFYELQVEAIDFAIQKHGAHKRSSKEIAVKLQALRDGIKESKQPAKPKRLLPMQTRNVGAF